MSNETSDETNSVDASGQSTEGQETSAAPESSAPKKTPRKYTKKKVAGAAPEESVSADAGQGEGGTQESPSETAGKASDEAPEGQAESKPEPKPEKPLPPVPDEVDLNELQSRPLAALHRLAVEAELRVAGIRSKHQLLFELVSYYGRRGTRITAEGVMEQEGNGYGFLRWPKFSFLPLPDDVYVPPTLIRNHSLRPGNKVKCTLRVPQNKEKFFAVDEVLEVEGIPQSEWQAQTPFDKLTALFPKQRIILEMQENPTVSSRVVDLMAPLGMGQRGLIVAPPRGGKTLLLKDIARSIHTNYPDVELIVMLLDERPEEVTDFRETVDAPVYSSTFDETPRRHIQVAEQVLDRAKRLVELKKDVVVLLDSLTRLARGYNLLGGGNTTQGGMKTKALERVRRYFGAARNVEEGGSLTLLATALIETESRMDDVIFEEFKGTGNMEIQLDRELVEKRVFPAIHLRKSGTRNDEKLYHPDEFKRITVLRRELAQMPAPEAMEVLIRNIHLNRSNAELLLKGLK